MILGFIKNLHPYVHKANKNAGWNFDMGSDQSLVNLQNININQYYDWHCDSLGDKPYDRKDPNHPEMGKIRKLSMTCQLTDGSEYDRW